jgi:hypothetical protein
MASAAAITAPVDPAGGLYAPEKLTGPLAVVVWPVLFQGGFYRERKFVTDAIRAHPSLTLVHDDDNHNGGSDGDGDGNKGREGNNKEEDSSWASSAVDG